MTTPQVGDHVEYRGPRGWTVSGTVHSMVPAGVCPLTDLVIDSNQVWVSPNLKKVRQYDSWLVLAEPNKHSHGKQRLLWPRPVDLERLPGPSYQSDLSRELPHGRGTEGSSDGGPEVSGEVGQQPG